MKCARPFFSRAKSKPSSLTPSWLARSGNWIQRFRQRREQPSQSVTIPKDFPLFVPSPALLKTRCRSSRLRLDSPPEMALVHSDQEWTFLHLCHKRVGTEARGQKWRRYASRFLRFMWPIVWLPHGMDSGSVAVVLEDPTHPQDLWSMSADGSLDPLTQIKALVAPLGRRWPRSEPRSRPQVCFILLIVDSGTPPKLFASR